MIDDTLREELSALIDGALPEERAKDLRRRIREDAELFREYAELERAVLAVRALPRPGAPVGLRARLDASLRPRRRGRILRLGALAAAATVLLAAGLAYYLDGGKAPEHFEARDEMPAGRGEVKTALEAQAPADESRRKAEDGVLAEKAAGEPRDEPAQEAAKLGRTRGAFAKKEEAVDLLAVVAKARRVAAADRKAYLRQLAALEPAKAREHVRAVVGDEPESDLRDGRAGAPPVLAAILLEDREEANLVKGILGAPPAAPGAAALAVEEAAKDQVTTEVSGTPDELARLGRWLDLLDLAPKDAVRPRVTVFGEAKREADAAPEVRKAVVRLRFGKPPEPKPEETPAKEK